MANLYPPHKRNSEILRHKIEVHLFLDRYQILILALYSPQQEYRQHTEKIAFFESFSQIILLVK